MWIHYTIGADEPTYWYNVAVMRNHVDCCHRATALLIKPFGGTKWTESTRPHPIVSVPSRVGSGRAGSNLLDTFSLTLDVLSDVDSVSSNSGGVVNLWPVERVRQAADCCSDRVDRLAIVYSSSFYHSTPASLNTLPEEFRQYNSIHLKLNICFPAFTFSISQET
jgi:hypothetical protein